MAIVVFEYCTAHEVVESLHCLESFSSDVDNQRTKSLDRVDRMKVRSKILGLRNNFKSIVVDRENFNEIDVDLPKHCVY